MRRPAKKRCAIKSYVSPECVQIIDRPKGGAVDAESLLRRLPVHPEETAWVNAPQENVIKGGKVIPIRSDIERLMKGIDAHAPKPPHQLETGVPPPSEAPHDAETKLASLAIRMAASCGAGAVVTSCRTAKTR